MNPAHLIPSPDPIPVPWGWFKALLILVFVIHLLLMNVMVGGSLIALYRHFRRKAWAPDLTYGTADAPERGLEKRIATHLTVVIALAINFGVAALLFLQTLYGGFFYVSSQLIAVYWLGALVLVTAAYYGAYIYKFKFDELGERRGLVIGGAALCFLIIGFIFANNMSLMLRPEAWTAYFDNPEGTLLNLSDPTLIPRYLHFMVSSVAVGGLFIAILGALDERRTARRSPTVDLGLRFFIYATLVQIVIGFWFQMALPRHVLLLFMGGAGLHTGVFLISLALVTITLALAINRRVWATAAGTVSVVLLMAVMRDLVRDAYLAPHFTLSSIPVTGGYGQLILFLVALTAGAVAIAYVLRLGLTATGGQRPSV